MRPLKFIDRVRNALRHSKSPTYELSAHPQANKEQRKALRIALNIPDLDAATKSSIKRYLGLADIQNSVVEKRSCPNVVADVASPCRRGGVVVHEILPSKLQVPESGPSPVSEPGSSETDLLPQQLPQLNHLYTLENNAFQRKASVDTTVTKIEYPHEEADVEGLFAIEEHSLHEPGKSGSQSSHTTEESEIGELEILSPRLLVESQGSGIPFPTPSISYTSAAIHTGTSCNSQAFSSRDEDCTPGEDHCADLLSQTEQCSQSDDLQPFTFQQPSLPEHCDKNEKVPRAFGFPALTPPGLESVELITTPARPALQLETLWYPTAGLPTPDISSNCLDVTFPPTPLTPEITRSIIPTRLAPPFVQREKVHHNNLSPQTLTRPPGFNTNLLAPASPAGKFLSPHRDPLGTWMPTPNYSPQHLPPPLTPIWDDNFAPHLHVDDPIFVEDRLTLPHLPPGLPHPPRDSPGLCYGDIPLQPEYRNEELVHRAPPPRPPRRKAAPQVENRSVIPVIPVRRSPAFYISSTCSTLEFSSETSPLPWELGTAHRINVQEQVERWAQASNRSELFIRYGDEYHIDPMLISRESEPGYDDIVMEPVASPARRTLDRTLRTPGAGLSFNVTKKLGAGAFGVVVSAECPELSKCFAVKVLHKPNQCKNGPLFAKVEFEILQAVTKAFAKEIAKGEEMNGGSAFLMKLIRSWDDWENIYLVMDTFAHDLRSMIYHMWRKPSYTSKLPVSDIRLYAAELVLGVKFLHDMRVVHRDLKLDNILISPTGHLTITDYGLSAIFPNTQGSQICSEYVGTPGYMPPEMILAFNAEENRMMNGYNGFAGDVWSLGVMIVELFMGTGKLFFDSPAHDTDVGKARALRIDWNVLYQSLDFTRLVEDHNAKDFLNKMMDRNPNSRMTLQEAMAHPFFAILQWKHVAQRKYTPSHVPGLPSFNTYGSRPIEFSEAPRGFGRTQVQHENERKYDMIDFNWDGVPAADPWHLQPVPGAVLV